MACIAAITGARGGDAAGASRKTRERAGHVRSASARGRGPAAAPKLLTLPAEKAALVKAQGIERFVLMPFTPAGGAARRGSICQPAVRRVRNARARDGVRSRFGRGRAGDVSWWSGWRESRASNGGRRCGAGQRSADFVDADSYGDRARGFGRCGALAGTAYSIRGLWCGAQGAAGRSVFRRSISPRPTPANSCLPMESTRYR